MFKANHNMGVAKHQPCGQQYANYQQCGQTIENYQSCGKQVANYQPDPMHVGGNNIRRPPCEPKNMPDERFYSQNERGDKMLERFNNLNAGRNHNNLEVLILHFILMIVYCKCNKYN